MTDDDLFAAFDSAALPGSQLGHREHVRLAFLYLQRSDDFATGAARFRDALKRFAHAQGAAGKFHETLTWAYLALVNEAMDGGADADSEAFVRRVPALLDQRSGALAARYDVEAILADPLARRTFVLPRRA